MLLCSILSTLIYTIIYVDSLRHPLCKNCVYYKPSFLNSYNFGECTKFGKKDNKTDVLVYQYTHICRDNENECGKNGTYFQRKIQLIHF